MATPEVAEVLHVLRGAGDVGGDDDHVGGDAGVDPGLGGQERGVAGGAHRRDAHGRAVEAVLLHQQGHRRRRHQRQVAADRTLPLVDEVEVAPLVDVAEHDGVDEADLAARLPAAGERVVDRLTGGGPHGPGEAARSVGLLAPLGDRRDPDGVTEHVLVTGRRHDRADARGQASPQLVAPPPVSGDGADAGDQWRVADFHGTPRGICGCAGLPGGSGSVRAALRGGLVLRLLTCTFGPVAVRGGDGGGGASSRPSVRSETRRQSGGRAAQPAGQAGPCRVWSRRRNARIQSRTVLRGRPSPAAMRRLPWPRSDSVSARPIDATSSSRRSRHEAGSSTWVRPQDRQRARRGRIQRSREPNRTSRGRAQPHRRKRPGPQEQLRSPASSARVTSAADSRTMRTSACRPAERSGYRPVGHHRATASQGTINACRGMSVTIPARSGGVSCPFPAPPP